MNDFSLINNLFDKDPSINGYKLETHMHTSESSACGCVNAKDMVKMYKLAGYDGIIVTDHFINGNSAVNRSLPWKQQMDEFFLGYETAYEAGRQIGLKVFQGLEYAYYGTEFIVMGLGKEWFYNHPDITSYKPEEFIPFFRKEGGFVIQVHPFRERSYIREIRLYPELVDAIETINIGNTVADEDRKAREMAIKYNKPQTAGSDAHFFARRFGAGVCLDKVPDTIYDVMNTLRSGKDYSLFNVCTNK